MAEPFLAEVRLLSFNFPPKGWARCDGQMLPINQNQALFALLGTQFGGNGQTIFALPDLRGRFPVHFANPGDIGQTAGAETHSLSVNEMPVHTHGVNASGGKGGVDTPVGNYLGTGKQGPYVDPGSPQPMNPAAVSSVGGGQPHENMPPFFALNFVIALQGIFPSRT